MISGLRLRAFADGYPALSAPARALWRRFNAARAARERETVMSLMANYAAICVGDPCVHVREFAGDFELDVRSAPFRRLLRRGAYEPELSAICRRHAEGVVDALDVGANVGFHSVLLAKLVSGRVLAVEPTSNAGARLERNLERNGVRDRVIAHRGAVSDREDTLTIKTIEGREEYSSLGELVHPAVRGERWVEETVRVDTLDALVARHGLAPGFMKIDVEGFEHRAIAGATELLTRHRPVIVAELSDPLLRRNGSSAREVVEALEALDYRVSDPLRPRARPGTREFGDLLCVPD